MRLGPFDGVLKPDNHWFGGRQGNHGYFGDDDWRPNEPGDWKWERHMYPHIFFVLNAWRTTKNSRIRASLELYHCGWTCHRTVATSKNHRSALSVIRWATRIFHQFRKSRWDLLKPWDAHRPKDTDHVYKLVNGVWLPFCSVFTRLASSWNVIGGSTDFFGHTWNSLSSGKYACVQPDGVIYMIDKSGFGICGGGMPPEDAKHLTRWTKWTPMPVEVLLPQPVASSL